MLAVGYRIRVVGRLCGIGIVALKGRCSPRVGAVVVATARQVFRLAEVRRGLEGRFEHGIDVGLRL